MDRASIEISLASKLNLLAHPSFPRGMVESMLDRYAKRAFPEGSAEVRDGWKDKWREQISWLGLQQSLSAHSALLPPPNVIASNLGARPPADEALAAPSPPKRRKRAADPYMERIRRELRAAVADGKSQREMCVRLDFGGYRIPATAATWRHLKTFVAAFDNPETHAAVKKWLSTNCRYRPSYPKLPS
jgi:hypothetical protein